MVSFQNWFPFHLLVCLQSVEPHVQPDRVMDEIVTGWKSSIGFVVMSHNLPSCTCWNTAPNIFHWNNFTSPKILHKIVTQRNKSSILEYLFTLAKLLSLTLTFESEKNRLSWNRKCHHVSTSVNSALQHNKS